MQVDTKRVRFFYVDSLRLTIHGEALYGKNREHIETIRAHRDDWSGDA